MCKDSAKLQPAALAFSRARLMASECHLWGHWPAHRAPSWVEWMRTIVLWAMDRDWTRWRRLEMTWMRSIKPRWSSLSRWKLAQSTSSRQPRVPLWPRMTWQIHTRPGPTAPAASPRSQTTTSRTWRLMRTRLWLVAHCRSLGARARVLLLNERSMLKLEAQISLMRNFPLISSHCSKPSTTRPRTLKSSNHRLVHQGLETKRGVKCQESDTALRQLTGFVLKAINDNSPLLSHPLSDK